MIACGDTRATVDPLGATLTGLWLGDQPILAGPGRVAPSLGHHGAVLTPWPNRLADGRYSFAGRDYQLPTNDPAYGSALHGLAFDQPWDLEFSGMSSVSFCRTVGGVDGYPFLVRVTVTYTATATGLRCDAAWVNVGDRDAPFGIGFHPYFRPGPSPLADWILKLAAPSYLETDPLTALPTRRRLVDDSGFDFREGRALGPDRFSIAYAVTPAEDVVLSDPAGLTLTIRTSPAFRWVQVFSGDRTGVGIEPQTCPANAFVTGTDLIVLQPGKSGSAAWSVDGERSRRGARSQLVEGVAGGLLEEVFGAFVGKPTSSRVQAQVGEFGHTGWSRPPVSQEERPASPGRHQLGQERGRAVPPGDPARAGPAAAPSEVKVLDVER